MPNPTVGFLLVPMAALASENLIENIRAHTNVTFADGVVHQVEADTRTGMQWKLQAWYNNLTHESYDGQMTYESIWDFWHSQSGFISYTFTTPDDLKDLAYFRFGLNGTKIDTAIWFDIKNVQPNTTYTLQWRVLNTTQGEIAWTDMFLTRCADGYALPLGNTTCVQMCRAGITRLRLGEVTASLYAARIGTPALCVEYNGQICYGHLVPGNGAGLNVRLDGWVYHLTH